MAETSYSESKFQPFPELLRLSKSIDENPTFPSGCKDVRETALTATKFIFDLALQSESVSTPHINALISLLSPSEAPQTRSQTRANGKRKRSSSPSPPKATFVATPISSLFVQGMDEDQIWEQLDLRAKHVCELLEHTLEGEEDEADEVDGAEGRKLRNALKALDNSNGLEFEFEDGTGLEDEDSEDGDDGDDSEDEEDEEEDEDESGDDVDLGEGIAELRDPSSSDDDDDDDDDKRLSLDPVHKQRAPSLKKSRSKHSDLDDDFFDLASFNAETEEAEAKSVSKGTLGGEEDTDDDDDVSVDYFAPVVDVEHFDEEDLENDATGAFYKDFFEPPTRVSKRPKSEKKPSANLPSVTQSKVRFHEEVRVKNIKAKGNKIPVSMMNLLDDDEEKAEDPYGQLISFDEEEGMAEGEDDNGRDSDSEDDSDDAHMLSEEDDGGGGRDTTERLKDDLFAEDETSHTGDMSAHEKRMSSLREQIKTLEKENVGPKDWVLMGEAGSRGRPHNSLLEEDLDFERVMKAVPVVTEETVQVLEEKIKARILEGRFDDVVRVRPVDGKPFLPSRFFELKDTKSVQSLAQIYEEEYTATQTGGVAGEDRDGKLKKEHDEIEQLWDNICGKLDALCNAHFVPKQPKATISTVSNVSTATLESMLPTTKSVSSILAPEEVFAPSLSDPRARTELTPAEKRALRGKERKSKKKTRDTLNKSVDKYAKMRGISGLKKQKQAALESVVKTGKGVTVVGKKSKDILVKKVHTRKSSRLPKA